MNILIVELAGIAFELTTLETSTMHVLLTATVGFVLLFRVSEPLTGKMIVINIALIAGFLAFFILGGPFFTLGSLFNRTAFFYLPLLYASIYVFRGLSSGVCRIEAWIAHMRDRRRQKKAA